MKPQIFSWLSLPETPVGIHAALASIILVAALCALPFSIMPMQPARAAPWEAPGTEFVVRSSLDTPDWIPGDGNCTDSGGNCTLRAAIEEANAFAGPDKITFANKMDIQLDTTLGALPKITQKLRIDASSVWDSDNNKPGVTVNGVNQTFSGLVLNADNCEVYGLLLKNFLNGVDILHSNYNTIGGSLPGQRNVINNNSGYGVSIHGNAAHHNVISGNWIGLSVSGDSKASNARGVSITGGAHQNTIGGNAPGKGNYISGNTHHGVFIAGAGSDGNRLGANFIGPPALGFSQNVGNGSSGVYVSNGPQNTYIGSTAPDLTGNDIAYNESGGVTIWDASGNWVEVNLIFGNKHNGVGIIDGSGNIVSSNEITSNTEDGIWIKGSTATGNSILANSIHHNGEQGIDLYEGGNTELAAPVVLTVNSSGASGTGCAGCNVHLYSDPENEGALYEGFASVDGSGNWSYSGDLAGPNVTATNTDTSGNTSEFSAPWRFKPLYLPIILRN